MEVDSNKIKRLRNEKLWSQEDLAEQAALGVRTVQRIEQSGVASNESARRLSNAFNVSLNELFRSSEAATPYCHKQTGYFILLGMSVILSFLATICVYVYVNVDGPDRWPAFYIMAATSLLLVILSLLFSSMTIKVDQSKIQWSFAFGFWTRDCALSEIADANVVQNNILHGFGIRLVGNGWLYNVSGLGAVELRLKSGSVIRLGSDEPEYLCHAVKAFLKQNSN